jgi:hypothetical protein
VQLESVFLNVPNSLVARALDGKVLDKVSQLLQEL